MKRYELWATTPGCDCCGPTLEQDENSVGEWVKYEEAAAQIAELQAAHNAELIRLFEQRYALERERDEAITLLRLWIVGKGDRRDLTLAFLTRAFLARIEKDGE